MLLAHAHTLAQARSDLAALADAAPSIEASSAYERALIELDRIHGDDVPAAFTDGLTDDCTALYAAARSAVEELVDHGVDGLDVELVLELLEEAHHLDAA